jgi:cation diffusion facilitator CzcD-associated flavoprotein CzcO
VADPDHEVAIIGAGPGGIPAAKLLRDKGITDFITLDRGRPFSRRSPLTDYEFRHQPANQPRPAPQAEELSA